ncbi:MAG: radical SAM protein [Thermodesulfobacteriota bacterium]
MSKQADMAAGQAVFGPVPSRRLGMSLGVDLLWPKTCSQDCLYCELGLTTHLTAQRGVFRDADQVLAQVEARLAELAQPPDFITLAGSGEPTLHQDLGRVLAALKGLSPARLAVLTNSTLLTDPAVRAELAPADVIVPSLDAASQAVFERLNRPAPGLIIEEIIEGLVALRREFGGDLWLEVLLVAGINDDPAELAGLAAAAERIGPDLVQLNTVVRPPAVAGTRPVEPERLAEIARLFRLPVQVTAPPQARSAGDRGALGRQVVEMTRRRPCTLADVSAMTGLSRGQALGLVQELVAAGRLAAEPFDDEVYYRGK